MKPYQIRTRSDVRGVEPFWRTWDLNLQPSEEQPAMLSLNLLKSTHRAEIQETLKCYKIIILFLHIWNSFFLVLSVFFFFRNLWSRPHAGGETGEREAKPRRLLCGVNTGRSDVSYKSPVPLQLAWKCFREPLLNFFSLSPLIYSESLYDTPPVLTSTKSGTIHLSLPPNTFPWTWRLDSGTNSAPGVQTGWANFPCVCVSFTLFFFARWCEWTRVVQLAQRDMMICQKAAETADSVQSSSWETG